MGYQITDAKEKHLEDLERLENSCFSCPWTREQLLMEYPDDRHVFLVAENEMGSAVAYAGMMHVLDEGYISNVAVDRNYRRQGIADMLIDAVLERAEALLLSFVTLEVRESNTAAKALYAKHAFAEVGRRKNYYERPREDAILMTTFLKRGQV